MYRFVFLMLLATFTTIVHAQWQPPRMPWGDPDLQGTWTNATVTVLERPEEIPDLVLTEAQALAIEGGAEAFMEAVDNVPEGDLQAGEDVGGYNAFWLDPGTRVLRVQGQPRGSIISDPENGRIPYTLWGTGRKYWALFQSQQRQNPESQLLGERCMVGFGSVGGPPMLPVLYNNNYQFVQTEGQVLILVEMNHNVRTIRIDGERLPEQIRPWLGDSIGRWEGETLVVETRQFHLQQNLRAAIKHQIYMTEDSKVVERFTRVSDSEILYTFTVEDNDLYTSPWTGEMTLRTAQGPIYEYACHEGNYSLPGILAGKRKEEQDEQEEGP